MSNTGSPGPAITLREARRTSARVALVAAAWRLVARGGLAGLTLRELAKEAGTTTPTVYSYFDSKNAIYDAMFGDAAAGFEAEMRREWLAPAGTPERLVEAARRFFDFCVSDIPRYQLLFQHSIPDFHPSDDSYAPAVRALQVAVDLLADCGADQPWQVDMWTAFLTGLVSQQIANDPGGDRWTALVGDVATMFLACVHNPTAPLRSKKD